ncbi:MAG: GNAT family N-acetyltransferase [Oscillospiraceae bacterium]
MFYCGIDIAKRNHEASVIDAEGKPLLDSIMITNTQEGCETLFSLFERLKIGKSDGQYLETALSGENIFAMRQLTRYRMALVDSCGDCKRRIIALLDQVFPEYANLFSDIFGTTSKELPLNCPTPDDMLSVSPRKLITFLNKAGHGRFGEEQAQEIRLSAVGSFGIGFVKNAFAFRIRQFVEQLMFLEDQIRGNRPYQAAPPKINVHSEHVRKATLADLPEVLSLFKKAIHSMNDNGIYQWDDIYPDEKILKSDIASESLYLYTMDKQPASVFVLNQKCNSEYSDGNWKYPLSSYAVVHRLCVNPAFQHMGIGTRTMLQVEILAKSMGIESIRLDAFSLNPAALRLYEKLGYAKTGVVTFRKGLFYLFEKKL